MNTSTTPEDDPSESDGSRALRDAVFTDITLDIAKSWLAEKSETLSWLPFSTNDPECWQILALRQAGLLHSIETADQIKLTLPMPLGYICQGVSSEMRIKIVVARDYMDSIYLGLDVLPVLIEQTA